MLRCRVGDGVDDAGLEQNVMFLHRLEQADVELSFPGRVEVKVSERKPDYYAAYIGNTSWVSTLPLSCRLWPSSKVSNDASRFSARATE